MTDWNLIGAVAFAIFALIFCIVKRKRFKTEGKFPFFYVLLYRTQTGIGLMDRLAKRWPRFWNFFGWLSIIVGFLAMIFLLLSLLMLVYNTFFVPDAVPIEGGLGLVLPFKMKGAIYVPFSYWIITLSIIMIMHEFMHGVIARRHNMKVKYSGFAFFGLLLPLVPGAFVEPDERQVKRAPAKQQMAMFAAGPVINILFGLLLLIPVAFFNPGFNQLWDYNGLNVVSVEDGLPADVANIHVGDKIVGVGYLEVDNFIAKDISTATDLNDALRGKKAGDQLLVMTERDQEDARDIVQRTIRPIELQKVKTEHFVTLQDVVGKDLGVTITESKIIREDLIRKHGRFLPNLGAWAYTLLLWLFILSLGVGSMNLLPAGPLDGGRMVLALFQKLFKKKRHAHVAWGCLTIFVIAVIAITIIASW